jgi:hypothetical protein
MPRLSVPAMVASAKKFGLKVEVVPGAETRGNPNFAPVVFVGHHTAGPLTGVRPSLNICVNGRSDLEGPLCNWFLDRNGVAVIVAAGVANHAGAGSFRGISGNARAQGCEAESAGQGDWTDAQVDAYPRVVAAGLNLVGRDESWYCAHRTWAPTRKIDPTGIADAWMRQQVKTLFANPQGDDVSYDDAARAIRDMLHLPPTGLKVPEGQHDNGNAYVNLLTLAQAGTNADNAIKGAVTQVLQAVKANTAITGDDEVKILAEVDAKANDLLAAIKAIPTGFGK